MVAAANSGIISSATFGYTAAARQDSQRPCRGVSNSMSRFRRRDLLRAWLLATLLSGLPSTLYALLTGRDPMEATRAAGAMMSMPGSLAAAALVHCTVSLFWAFALWLVLPQRHTLRWALAASVAIALLDLRVIAPAFFPEVAALDFWPQLADHVLWGACVGYGLIARRPPRAVG